LGKLAGGICGKAFGISVMLTLAACTVTGPLAVSPSPQTRPTSLVALAPPAPELATRSDASRALSLHFQRVQNDLLARGLLRTDGGGPDTTYTDTVLARNFVRIALFDEFVATPTGLRAQPTISRLRRWEQPVRFVVEFGNTVPNDQRLKDIQSVSTFVSRLSRVTGEPMGMNDTNSNFHVLILNEDDRLEYGGQLRALVPGIDATTVQAFMDLPPDTLCLVLAFSEGGSPQYSRAVALIRGEHPDLMRLACIHEELTQGLGLANDSPRARPSIFNDDEEFGLLTSHDELLLKILYDDRLRTGMTAAVAAPIARVIATELMNNGPA
jgi:hypothetical protein